MTPEAISAISADELARLQQVVDGTSVSGMTEIQVATPGVTFATRNVPPFAPTYLGIDDHVRVQITNRVSGARIMVSLRMQIAGGEFQIIERDYFPPATGVPLSDIVPMREGWLFGIAVRSTGIPVHLAAYVQVGIQRATSVGGLFYNWWIQDVVNDSYSPSWPPGRQLSQKEALGITDYDVAVLLTTDAESLPIPFAQTTRRIDIVVRTNPVLVRLFKVDGTSGEQFRVEAGMAWNLDGAFTAFTVQSATAGASGTVQVVGWW